MNLIIQTPSDLARFFEEEPAPFWGARRTMLDDTRVAERTVHASELSLDFLFSQPNVEGGEESDFDLDTFLNTH
jgi:hypothetical protein